MSLSARLRLALLLIVLLPGLLFQGGGSLRVCLQGGIDKEDGCCQVAAPSFLPSITCQGCCAGDQDVGQGPELTSGGCCGACCVEFDSEGAPLTTPSQDVDGLFVTLAPPLHDVGLPMPAPPVRRLIPRTVVLPHAPPGRAPTPLRI